MCSIVVDVDGGGRLATIETKCQDQFENKSRRVYFASSCRVRRVVDSQVGV